MAHYPEMKGFTTKELSEALSSPSHPRHKAARMAATHKEGYETPKVIEAKSKAIHKKKLPKHKLSVLEEAYERDFGKPMPKHLKASHLYD